MLKTTLVNKDNKFKENYLKKIELIKVKNINNEDIFIEKETYMNYQKLKDFLKTKNINIEIKSAYRDIETQQEIYNDFYSKCGEEYCDDNVAIPYYSEHHTGLAIDIAIIKNSKEIDNKIESYEEIHKYLKDFGFILRYPKDKENITGYRYEPWHIRYVTKFIANIIGNNNLTLEEYLKDFSCLIAVNKKKDMTSFDVVNEISKLFGIKKVGHTGTLDPLAEGVLIVAIGKATKVVELVTSSYKEYIAEVKLGIKTDTKDITGEILETKELKKINNLEEVINSFKKTYMQEVPIYSAVKVNGKKLYEYARNNEKVILPKKEVTIKEIELLSSNDDSFKFKTLVSKGCYIRSLIEDIAEELNTIGTMTSLTRTKQANISINNTYTLEDIKNGNYKLYSIDEVLDYEVVVANKELEFKIKNGQTIENTFNIKDKVIFKNEEKKLLGIYENNEGKLKVWKNF